MFSTAQFKYYAIIFSVAIAAFLHIVIIPVVQSLPSLPPPSINIVSFGSLSSSNSLQRRPFGFTRPRSNKAQVWRQAFRRRFTASGRLSSEKPQPPDSIGGSRTEYRGSQHRQIGDQNAGDLDGGSTPVSIDKTPCAFAARGPEYRFKRPYSAGCHSSLPFTFTVADSSSPTETNILSAAVDACTRDPAGIVRGGGRGGRSALPPTPPRKSPSTPPSTTRLMSATPGNPSRTSQAIIPYRRPSTAGQARRTNCKDHPEHPRSSNIDDVVYGFRREGVHAAAGLADHSPRGSGVHSFSGRTTIASVTKSADKRASVSPSPCLPSGGHVATAGRSTEPWEGNGSDCDTDDVAVATDHRNDQSNILEKERRQHSAYLSPSGRAGLDEAFCRRRPVSATPVGPRSTYYGQGTVFGSSCDGCGHGSGGESKGPAVMHDRRRRPKSGAGVSDRSRECEHRNTCIR